LKIMKNEEDSIALHRLWVQDGLVINREDESGWLIDAYVSNEYKEHYKSLIGVLDVMIQAKITREENAPAFFIKKIASVNQISDEQISVLFEGFVVDHSKNRIEEMLRMIMEEGYQGESLLKKFKDSI